MSALNPPRQRRFKRRFKVNKVLRDKMTEKMLERDVAFSAREISGDERIPHLKDKLLEEVTEVLEASTQAEIHEELADVLEVIHAIANVYKLPFDAIETARLHKKEERGGFEQCIHVDFVTMNTDNPAIKYYTQKPEQYPEEEYEH